MIARSPIIQVVAIDHAGLVEQCGPPGEPEIARGVDHDRIRRQRPKHPEQRPYFPWAGIATGNLSHREVFSSESVGQTRSSSHQLCHMPAPSEALREFGVACP
jgi:hypothetical protein